MPYKKRCWLKGGKPANDKDKALNDRLGLTPIKAGLILLVCALLGGLAALVAVLSCYFLLNFGGVESADKHGISSNPAIRIGGVLIVVYLLLNLSFQTLSLNLPTLGVDSTAVLIGALPFFVLGLYEDLRGLLSARFRFVFMLLIAAWLLIYDSRFVILPLGQPLIDGLLFEHDITAWAFSALCLAFLPNAFNTADGANGLISGLAFVVVMLLSSIAPESLVSFLHSVAIGCLLFLIYNLATGRFFLGDGGAYFLGALVGLSLIRVSNATEASPWFLATLIFYPVADLVFSMGRRVASGRSPFSADNEHFHNLVFAYLKDIGPYARQANTLTGLGVVLVFSGATAALQQMGWLSSNSDAWIFVYALFWSIYVLIWRALQQRVCVINQASAL